MASNLFGADVIRRGEIEREKALRDQWERDYSDVLLVQRNLQQQLRDKFKDVGSLKTTSRLAYGSPPDADARSEALCKLPPLFSVGGEASVREASEAANESAGGPSEYQSTLGGSSKWSSKSKGRVPRRTCAGQDLYFDHFKDAPNRQSSLVQDYVWRPPIEFGGSKYGLKSSFREFYR